MLIAAFSLFCGLQHLASHYTAALFFPGLIHIRAGNQQLQSQQRQSALSSPSIYGSLINSAHCLHSLPGLVVILVLPSLLVLKPDLLFQLD